MKVRSLHVLIVTLCGIFVTMHGMDEQTMVCVKTSTRHTVIVPFAVIRDHLARIPFFALGHETIFVHNCLRTQKHIPKVNSVLGDNTQKDKILVRYVPQSIQYLPVRGHLIDDGDDDHNIHIDFEPQEGVFSSQQHFEYISRMPEGPALCFCNTLCGAAMLGLVLILTFCK